MLFQTDAETTILKEDSIFDQDQSIQQEEKQIIQVPESIEFEQNFDIEEVEEKQPVSNEEQSEQHKILNNDVENEEDMESYLNPDAAEFVPTSIPSHMSQQEDNDLISGSPLKQSQRALKNHDIPSEDEFKEEISGKPSELEDTIMSDYSNGTSSPQKISTNLLDAFNDENEPIIVAKKNFLDESDVSSTKAEFGDETNFSAFSELQKTGYSNLDFSYSSGLERSEFDFTKDAMTTSMTPSDFKHAFEQEEELDLNKVHELKDEDLEDVTNGSFQEEKNDAETDIDNLSKENIELDLHSFALDNDQNLEAFSAVIDQKESDLFMNKRNIEHDSVKSETIKSNAEETYVGSNPFTNDYESRVDIETDLEKVISDMQNVEIAEKQEQKNSYEDVMHNPLELNFSPVEQKTEEHVLVTPIKEPQIVSSKFVEESLIQESTNKSEFSLNSFTVNPSEPAIETSQGISDVCQTTTNFVDVYESEQKLSGFEQQVTFNQFEEPQTLKESLVDEQKDVEEISTETPLADINADVPSPLVTNEENIISNESVAAPVAETVAVAAAAVVATAAAASAVKSSIKPAATKTLKSNVTSKIGSKSSSPAKTATTGTAAKKPVPAARTTTTKPAVPATKTANKTSATGKLSTTAPKTTTTSTLRTSTTSAAKSKLSSVTSKIGSLPTDKKPTTNGDVKSNAKPPPITRPTSKSTTATTTTTTTKPALVKTSANLPKTSRPASAATTTKTITSKVNSTISSSTSATAARPKTAPTSAYSSVKSKIGSVPAVKSPIIDKQSKDSTNKQISSARSAVAKSRLSTLTGTNATSAAIKRTSLAPKTQTTAATPSPVKKSVPRTAGAPKTTTPGKVNSNVTSIKTSNNTITKTKVVENGVNESTEKSVQKIENDILIAKDNNQHNDVDRHEDNNLISIKD